MKFRLVESLNDFKKVKISAQSIDKYKHQAPFLKHIRDNGKGYIILDGDNVVGVINTEDKNGDVWIQGIEISKQYQNKGIGKELLDYAVKNLGVTHLSVNKKNTLAYDMYLKCGFEVYDQTDSMYFMTIDGKL